MPVFGNKERHLVKALYRHGNGVLEPLGESLFDEEGSKVSHGRSEVDLDVVDRGHAHRT